MKKLLTMLGSIALIATTSAAVVACGGKNPPQSSEKQPSENSNTPTDESKKDDEKGKLDISKVEDKNIGNFQPDSKKTIPQKEIKKKLAELLSTHESNLSNLDVDYTTNKGKVTLPVLNNKTLNFTFTSILDLGQFEFKNKVVSVAEIKKKISDLLKIESKYLYELEVDSVNNSGTVKSSKPDTFSGKFEFKFSVKETMKNEGK
ncbi:hypothetical protein MFERI14815_00856 [Mycoplasma feriruminatoris]|uniref:lipoprotein n=1 Tax=Mycoplasma feriruminatoris TaxID=1179777 RepID=UPI00241D6699|nr:lipoprotein [Mycoplasma feriruminatoris]WFQ92238.1 hypothetical protein MFERI14815_00856 [Mycoplasma feriruminatoris]